MFLTIIPFIADGVANDWPKAVACLERTIGSVFGNPQRELRAMVVCQDRPPLNIADPRYIFLESKQPKPDKRDYWAKGRDKGNKIVEAFDAARELLPKYVMLVDADDLISNTLVSYVYQRPTFDAFCLKTGYNWEDGSRRLMVLPQFNQRCATAFIWRFNERLFPAWIGKTYTKRVADQGHNLVEAPMDAEGANVDKIYVPKAIYVTGLVNNLGRSHQLTIKRRIKYWLLFPWRSRIFTPALKAEFGLIDKGIK